MSEEKFFYINVIGSDKTSRWFEVYDGRNRHSQSIFLTATDLVMSNFSSYLIKAHEPSDTLLNGVEMEDTSEFIYFLVGEILGFHNSSLDKVCYVNIIDEENKANWFEVQDCDNNRVLFQKLKDDRGVNLEIRDERPSLDEVPNLNLGDQGEFIDYLGYYVLNIN